MKKLTLQSENFQTMLDSFQTWMSALNYAEQSIITFPRHVREYLHFLETQNIYHVTRIHKKATEQFMVYIQFRPNQTQTGGLSTYSINKIIVALNLFFKYLSAVGCQVRDLSLHRIPDDYQEPQILTPHEIDRLFEATYVNHGKNHVAIGTRDRAMLALFYGCGLRRSEGINLNTTDINLIKRQILITGKGNKERVVPISHKAVTYIEAYLHSGREWFLMTHKSSKAKSVPKQNTDKNAFLLSERGKRLDGGIYRRLETLKAKANIHKKIGIHTFRHSIATHLLVQGMEIEDIAKFLGHASLESTQVYTHISYNYEQLEELAT